MWQVLEQDEDAMSESDIVSSPEPESASPMSLESVCISSPSLRHTKPALQLLYDMDEYRKDIFQYLLQAEVCSFTTVFLVSVSISLPLQLLNDIPYLLLGLFH